MIDENLQVYYRSKKISESRVSSESHKSLVAMRHSKGIMPRISAYRLLAVAIVVILLATTLVVALTHQRYRNVPWLHAYGTEIYDESGHRVTLYGVNFVSGQHQGGGTC
jgi:hypothetical protein